MALLILAYFAGVLTIASPCIFPILPFVLVRAGESFVRSGIPMLFGMVIAFMAVASLASVAGGWAVGANRYGRDGALAMMALYGLATLLPALSARMMAPIVSVGSSLSGWAEQRAVARVGQVSASILIGVATGLVWTPYGGPVLGLILTGAALHGPSVETSILLLAYGWGAATSLAAGVLLGGRLLVIARRSVRWAEVLRRGLGAAVVVGAAATWLELDTGLLTRVWSVNTNTIEQHLTAILRNPPTLGIGTVAHAEPAPALSGPLSALLGARQWLNTPPLRPEDLRGNVILANFWTYSCINCLRVLPHVRAWAEKYKGRRLVVIGVQTPEFAFEKDVGNIRKALVSLGITYPVAVDNDFGIWRAFGNQAWPALYFIGQDGRIHHHVFGEGRYEDSERLIQILLSEADGAPVSRDTVTVGGKGTEAAADEADLRSPETYIGYAEATNFASPGGATDDSPRLYRTAAALPLNQWGLEGNWTIGREFAALNGTSGGINYRSHARDLNLVLAPSPQGNPIRFRVKINGAPPGADHGFDVDAEGWGSVQQARLYQLVRQAGPVADRTFEIEFFDPGVQAFAFTFG
jgi:cytochrome c biogenesis protein CcdA/thiol-disulfide isomerase/thioredoxin